MKLTDIAPLENWVELENQINQRSGLDANLFSIEGYRISDCKNWANKLCPQIKATDKGQSFICAPAHMNIANQAMKTRKAVVEECDAGLVKIVVPVFVDEEFVGAVGACGFLFDDAEVDSFLIYKMTDMEEKKIESLSREIPSITREKAESITRYISTEIGRMLADHRVRKQ